MSELEIYYNEHASQARQHEDQRERMTNIILSVAGVLVGLITFSELSIWSLPAAIALLLIGLFGFIFAGKHYERFRYHVSVMKAIRDEIDKVKAAPQSTPTSLKKLRRMGVGKHYDEFTWPACRATKSKDKEDKKPDSEGSVNVKSENEFTKQENAKAWIAR